jgi:anti-anti-sigma factor
LLFALVVIRHRPPVSALQQIDSGVDVVLNSLNDSSVKNVVLDFRRTDYFGTTALGFFLKLWKRIRDRNGRMALCNASEHEKEVLNLTKFDSLWPICTSREAAVRLVKE